MRIARLLSRPCAQRVRTAQASGWCCLLGVALALGLGGCKSRTADDPGAAPSTPIGTPKPPFIGPLPAGAEKVTAGEIGRYGGSMVLSIASDPATFNPILVTDQSSGDILHGPLFASCLDFDHHSQEVVPALCEGYERSEDGLTYTFTLREGLTWSDGAPLTSDDFEFSYQVLLDPDVITSVRDLFRQGDDAEGKPRLTRFEKLDARRFRFHLQTPDVLFHVNVASIYVVPKHKWAAAAARGEFNQLMRLNVPPAELVTSGPFVLSNYTSGERVVLTRNPRYWKVDRDGNRLPYLDRVIYVIVRDNNAQFVRFRDGDLDAIAVQPEHFDALKRDEPKADYVLSDLGPSFYSYYLMFNLDPRSGSDGKPYVDPSRRNWFENKLFRQAVSHAIDREGMIRTVLAGRGSPMFTVFGPANKKWHHPGARTWPHDLERARALLTEAGFVLKNDTLHDAAGNPVEFSVLTNSENATRIGMVNVIKDDLARLGIKVHLRPAPFNEVVDALRNSRNFEGLLLGWGTAVPPDPAQWKNVLLSSGASHAWHPSQTSPSRPWEKAMDEALYANIGTTDFAERKKHMDRVLEIWAEELPQIMLVAPQQYAAGRKNLGNFKPSRLRPELSWDIEQIFLRQPKRR